VSEHNVGTFKSHRVRLKSVKQPCVLSPAARCSHVHTKSRWRFYVPLVSPDNQRTMLGSRARPGDRRKPQRSLELKGQCFITQTLREAFYYRLVARQRKFLLLNNATNSAAPPLLAGKVFYQHFARFNFKYSHFLLKRNISRLLYRKACLFISNFNLKIAR